MWIHIKTTAFSSKWDTDAWLIVEKINIWEYPRKFWKIRENNERLALTNVKTGYNDIGIEIISYDKWMSI